VRPVAPSQPMNGVSLPERVGERAIHWFGERVRGACGVKRAGV